MTVEIRLFGGVDVGAGAATIDVGTRASGVPEVAISRGSGGYTLSVDPAHIDLHRFRELGDRHREATILRCLGHTYRAIGDDPAAWEVWHQAAAILRELDHPDLPGVRADLATLDGLA